MEIRDAVEADAQALADIAASPADVMRELVHDRTVRVAVEPGDGGDGTHQEESSTDRRGNVVGFVSYDSRDGVVHVTQVGGSPEVCEALLADPVGFAEREGLPVEAIVPVNEAETVEAATTVGFERAGAGPRFDGRETVRLRIDR